ncbi:MAG: hypothetical protein U0X91_25030 [Spirosomataceae bacterium]
MMKKELTKEHINRLYRYAADNGVNYFDVQVELVDHIATAIEERLNTHPEQTVDDTLKEVIASFEKYGLKKIVKEKEKQVRRQYRRYEWESFKSFFSWPRIIVTALLTWVLFEFLRGTNKETLTTINEAILLPTFILGVLYGIFLFYRKLRMALELSFTHNNAIAGLALINTHYIAKLILKYTMLGEGSYPFLAAVLLTLFFLLIAASIQAREKLYHYSKKLYPQAFA